MGTSELSLKPDEMLGGGGGEPCNGGVSYSGGGGDIPCCFMLRTLG